MLNSRIENKVYDKVDASFDDIEYGHIERTSNKASFTQYTFPNDLLQVSEGHWVAITISKQWKWKQEELSKSDIQKVIFLPVPTNLSTGYRVDWRGEDLGVGGVVGARLANTIKPIVDGGVNADNVKSTINNIGRQISNSLTNGEIAGASMNAAINLAESELVPAMGAALSSRFAIGGALIAGGLQNAFKGAMGALGVARNPHKALLFSGVDFKTHNFQYKFTPSNRVESVMLDNIIKCFKFHMSPQLTHGDFLFDYPEVFDIDFNNEHGLFNIGTSVLTGFEVNYHGEGGPLYHNELPISFGGDSTSVKYPVSVILNLTFQETTIVTKGNIEKDRR